MTARSNLFPLVISLAMSCLLLQSVLCAVIKRKFK